MTTKVNFSRVQQDYFPLQGGLDLVSPAIDISPGCTIDSQNYEPSVTGSPRRIDGYERYDGRASPSAASYWVVPVSSCSAAVGATVTGGTSAATGVVLLVAATYIVCARVSGSFAASESLTVAGSPVGATNGAMLLNGASTPSDHADYLLLAANDQRQFIQVVPGSGPIRGVWVYNDTVYAFRDNAGGTAGNMWKATSSGWVQIVFKSEIQFQNATGQINVGDTVVGGTSGATATVTTALLRTGTWTSSGVGSLILSGVTGTFASGEAIKVSGVSKATSTTVSAPITRAPGGQMSFFNYNFTGSTLTKKMYGVDGVNTAFEFDGTTYVPIRTGMATDTPSQVIAHRGYLFLSFLASVQFSAIGNPYAWTIVLGAGEIDVSSVCTGFLPQGGNGNGSSLAIFTAERTFILYGTSNADFKLVSSIFDMGYMPFTCQQVSNDAWGMTGRGIQALITTLNYGDFDYSSISHMVQPLISRKRGLECASTSNRTKNQYRIYYTDGTAIVAGLTGNKVSGLMPLNYQMPVRCICTTTLTNGSEVTYFGSDSGYVYMDNIGTSQDGNPIEAWVRLPFTNSRSPRVRKRYRRAVLEVSVEGFAKINISYDLGYGNQNVMPSAPQADSTLSGSGGYWDQFTWDQFTWDTQYVSNPTLSIEGTEKNISLIFYSIRAQDQSHILSGVTLLFSPHIIER